VRYAFMTFSCPQLTLDEVLALARRFGYDGIEPRIDSGHKHGVEIDADPSARAEIKRRAEATGVSLCCLATSCKFADPATVADNVEQAKQAIDLAADVGAPRVRVFGGSIPSGVTREQAADSLVESLLAVADLAHRRGVIVCLETHDDWRDPAHLVRVLERVGHPAIAANWDIMHPIRAGVAMDKAFAIIRPWIRHVHFHDGIVGPDKLEMCTIGAGMIDHRTAVRCLRALPYGDFLSGEWINWEPYETHLPRELATMKSYEARAS
jgi:sugar phosphate isomerase/epimerase